MRNKDFSRGRCEVVLLEDRRGEHQSKGRETEHANSI